MFWAISALSSVSVYLSDFSPVCSIHFLCRTFQSMMSLFNFFQQLLFQLSAVWDNHLPVQCERDYYENMLHNNIISRHVKSRESGNLLSRQFCGKLIGLGLCPGKARAKPIPIRLMSPKRSHSRTSHALSVNWNCMFFFASGQKLPRGRWC